APGPGEVLVEVRAAGINPLDWHFMRGEPRPMRLQSGLRSPKDPRTGQDLAGVVVEVGEGVTRWAVGDEVLGSCLGALAQYAVAGEGDVAAKPQGMNFTEASGLPCAGLTAIQGLRDTPGSPRGTGCSSRARAAASDTSRCRSPRRRAPTSRACARRATSTWSA